ncbi:MAG: UDP-N-acetylmuramoyl-L-alanine--D-glutamate ligase [Legionella sp.]|nr:UDP-N-acetylmuramoyl-L-alanine--D-glutamate ligase [Legionella sp.]
MTQSHYLIAGLGKTGFSIARHLQRQNKPFIVFDTRKQPPELERFQQLFPESEVILGTVPVALYPKLKAVIASPGVSLEDPSVQQARALNIPVYGDIECFAREVKAPVVAITGTNGKSTVTTLVGEMAKAAGFSVAVAGNIGAPVLDLLEDGSNYDLWVLELSSFQLDLTSSLKPIAATILNISTDHLDRHHTFDAYLQAKQRIYQHAAYAVYNRADPHTAPQVAMPATITIEDFSLQSPLRAKDWGVITNEAGTYLAYGDKAFLSVEELGLKGKHNWENALAASALALKAGVPWEAIVKTLTTFQGLPHRCQWVRTLRGIHWINDSKGTNVGATASAICGIGDAIDGKIVLIAGGQGKGADFKELTKPVENYVRALILIGEDAPKIAADLTGVAPMCRASSLEEAILLAEQQASSGDVVLLSPACASFDMFQDYVHRGDVFAQLVAAR